MRRRARIESCAVGRFFWILLICARTRGRRRVHEQPAGAEQLIEERLLGKFQRYLPQRLVEPHRQGKMAEQHVPILGRHICRRVEEPRDLLAAIGRVERDAVAREQACHAGKRGGEKIMRRAANRRRQHSLMRGCTFRVNRPNASWHWGLARTSRRMIVLF